jgi:hypothetical protein
MISNETTEIYLYEINVGNVGDAEGEGEFLFGCVTNLSLFHMMVLLPLYLFRDYDFWSLHKITHKFMISLNIFQYLFKISHKIFKSLYNTFHKIFYSLFNI